jgi:RimJ/RimL family protein N-acetyltransferase
VSIRSLRRGDFEGIRAAIALRYDEREAGTPIWTTMFRDRPTSEHESSAFENLIGQTADGSAVVKVAEKDGRVVGFCTIATIIPGEASEQSHVGELGILVHRDHRGKGIGAALLDECLKAARQRFEMVYLSVWSKNESAIRLYRRFGFSVCGHFPRIVKRAGQYFDEDRMVLDLSPNSPGPGANR